MLEVTNAQFRSWVLLSMHRGIFFLPQSHRVLTLKEAHQANETMRYLHNIKSTYKDAYGHLSIAEKLVILVNFS